MMNNEPPTSPPVFIPGQAPGYAPGPPTSPPPPQPHTAFSPPSGFPSQLPPDPQATRQRPWWGLGDALLAIPFVLVFALIGGLIGIVAGVAAGEISFDADDLQSDLETNALLLVIAVGGQQLGQFVWPLIVGKWKGFGAAHDFGFRFKWIDIPIGLGAGLLGLILATMAGAGLGWLLNVDPDDADNTSFLTENTDSPWFWGLVAVTVIGAPFSEELLFRGLILRAFEKRWGWVAGLVGSSIIFMLVHFQTMSGSELAVLFAAIGTAGAVFGALAIKTGRIGSSIIAHMLFNGTAVAAIYFA